MTRATNNPQLRATHRNRDPNRIARARLLRQTQTDAERAAWYLLRELSGRGLKFRPQHR